MTSNLEIYYQLTAVLSFAGILLFCLFCIFHKGVEDGVLGRLLYSVAAISAAAGLMHMAQGTYPERSGITLLAVVALIMMRYVLLKSGAWASLRQFYFKHHKGPL